MQEYLIFEESIFEFLPSLIPYLIFAVGMYLGITLGMDKKTRKLFEQKRYRC